jgi:hypothetical protein
MLAALIWSVLNGRAILARSRRSESKCARSKGSNFHAANGPMHKRQQFSRPSYLTHRERRHFDSRDAIDKDAVEVALDRCRVLAAELSELCTNKPEYFVDKLALGLPQNTQTTFAGRAFDFR